MNVKHEGYITRNKQVMMGKPCIKGTRITVELILTKMSEGATVEQLMDDYPGLTKESIPGDSAWLFRKRVRLPGW